MKKRMQYIILFVTFIPAFLIAWNISSRLVEPYMGSIMFFIPPYDCFGLNNENTCQYENVGSVSMDCPSLFGKKQSKPATITISNLQDEEQEYYTNVYAVFRVEEGRYHEESICSNTLTVAPRHFESFTCEVDSKALEGEIFSLHARISPEGKACAGFKTHCSTRSYYLLYMLIPFIVAALFFGWFIKIASSEKTSEPEPESDPGDA